MNRAIILFTALASFVLNDHAQTVIDIDGNVYNTMTIGTQIWLKENLKVTRYSNGDSISNVIDDSQWVNLTTGACSIYDNDTNNSGTYGRLYNWYAASDSRNACPVGWHTPLDDEFGTLITNLGGIDIAGGKLKEAGTEHWLPPNTGATNENGFTGLPGGYRNGLKGFFENKKAFGHWWSSTRYDSSQAWGLGLFYLDIPANRSESIIKNGFSIRCIKNSTSQGHNIENNKNLHIYPNPARSVITIITIDYDENEKLYLSVYNMKGDLILPGIIDKTANKIDISSLPEGIYLL